MTTQQDVFAALTAILPVIGVLLPGIIKSDGLSAEQNSLITFVILLVAGGAQAWSAGQVGANVWLDFVAVEAAMSSLLSGPLQPIDAFLQTNIGFISTKPPASSQPQIVRGNTAPMPTSDNAIQP